MLQLALGAGYSLDEIRDVFETPLREAIYAPKPNSEWFSAA